MHEGGEAAGNMDNVDAVDDVDDVEDVDNAAGSVVDSLLRDSLTNF